MKLGDYLQENKESITAFAARIGRDHSTVSRLARGKQRPDWDTMRAITEATGGAVQPNDFSEAA